MEHHKFWQWFERNSDHLRPEKITRLLQNELDRWTRKLEVPSWEIGPYDDLLNLDFLALSPSGDSQKFELTKAIIEKAPALERWIFLAAKPPKKWSRSFFWSSAKTPIDASNWNFLVYKYDDGLSDVVLVDDILNDVESESRKQLLDFVISSEIGELGMMNSVCGIDIDTTVDDQTKRSSVKLTELKAVLGVG